MIYDTVHEFGLLSTDFRGDSICYGKDNYIKRVNFAIPRLKITDH